MASGAAPAAAPAHRCDGEGKRLLVIEPVDQRVDHVGMADPVEGLARDLAQGQARKPSLGVDLAQRRVDQLAGMRKSVLRIGKLAVPQQERFTV